MKIYFTTSDRRAKDKIYNIGKPCTSNDNVTFGRRVAR